MKKLRIAFFSCLLLNLVFFVWAQGYLGNVDPNREPARMNNQLAPEKLQIARSESTKPSPPANVAKTEAVVTPPPAEPKPVPATIPAVQEKLCRLIGPLTDEAQAKALRVSLLAQLQGAQIKQLTLQSSNTNYWVHIPALASREAAEKKAAELRRLSVTEHHIMSDESPNRNAISLGLFRSEASARELLSNLIKKGVKSARIETRGAPPSSQLEIRADSSLIKRLPELLKNKQPLSVADCPA